MEVKNNTLVVLIVMFMMVLISGCDSKQGLNGENVSVVSSADGSAITYGVRGQGDITVVFIHCWTCNHEFWRPQIEFFSKKHRVVWLDLAGHGLSSSNRQQYTMSAFGQDVAAVVNKTGGGNVILVGHSMGGPVAIEAARLLGEKVTGIVGVDTFYIPFVYPKSSTKIDEFVKPFKDDFKGASERMVRSMFTPKVDPDLITSIVNQLSVADRNLGISAMYEIFGWSAKNVPSTLDKYSKKLRNINGAPTGKEIALHESVVLIPGVGHFVAQVKPDEFNETLSAMITEFQVR